MARSLVLDGAAAIPELLPKEAYGAINGALTTPMTISRAVAALAAAALWTAAGSHDTTMAAIVAISIVTTLAFWWAASRR